MPANSRFYTNLGLDPEILKHIDLYKESRMIATRTKAIHELLEIALVNQGIITANDGQPAPPPPFHPATPVVKKCKFFGWSGDL